MKPLRLLVENVTDDLETIVENVDNSQEKNYFIQGPYLMSETKNRNNRIYQLKEMISEVEAYKKEFIDNRTALGELGHPLSNDPSVNLERAAHLVISLEQKDNLFYGKSKLLSTPTGNIAKSLVKEGIRLGISSRALGNLTQMEDYNLVNNFKLICLDLVHQPSCQHAILDAVLENKQYIIEKSGKIVEINMSNLEKSLKSLPKKDIDNYLEEQFKKFINSIK